MAEARTAHVFISDDNRLNTMRENEQKHLQSTAEQLELFAVKYPEMDKDSLTYISESLFEGDSKLSAVLEEANLKSVMDDIGAEVDEARVKDFLAKLPATQNGKGTFTQIACMIFNKPFQDAFDFHDPEAEARTQAAAAAAQKVQEQIATEKEAKVKAEEEAKVLEEKIKSNLHKAGVAGKAAFFENKAKAVTKPKYDLEQAKHERALEKQKKEAEKALAKALEDEAIRAKEIEEQAAEIKKNLRLQQLADKMGQYGIASPLASPAPSTKLALPVSSGKAPAILLEDESGPVEEEAAVVANSALSSPAPPASSVALSSPSKRATNPFTKKALET